MRVSEDTRGSFLEVGLCDNLDIVVSEIQHHPVLEFMGKLTGLR